MGDKVKLAFVGCGAITASSHLPAALRSPLLEVTALVDQKRDLAERLAADFVLRCPVADRLDDVIGEVDAVVIATPNRSHFDLASTALQHGRGVLVEKPMTTTYADAVRLCELSEQHNAVLAVGYVTRHFPSVLLMKHLLETGYLGSVQSFEYEFGSKGGWEPVSGYNVDRSMSGGGVLIIQGTHFLDRMLYWFGEPTSWSYADDNYGGVEGNCKASFQFDRGHESFQGSIFISKTMRLKNRFLLRTDKYKCVMWEGDAQKIVLWPNSERGLRIELRNDGAASDSPDFFRAQLEQFADAMRNGRAVFVDGRAGAASVRLIEQLYARRVQLEEPWLMYRRTARQLADCHA